MKKEDFFIHRNTMYKLIYCRKKLSNFGTNTDWESSTMCVVKKYMEDTDRKSLFDDVRLQMDAKLWGEEYNKHQPPKKVKFLLMVNGIEIHPIFMSQMNETPTSL